VKDLEQPLLGVKSGDSVLYLVPEMCMMTGVSESERTSPAKFNMMKEVVNETEHDA